MKSYLFFAFFVVFSVSLSAQISSPIKTSDLKKEGMELMSKQKPDQQDLIKKALTQLENS